MAVVTEALEDPAHFQLTTGPSLDVSLILLVQSGSYSTSHHLFIPGSKCCIQRSQRARGFLTTTLVIYNSHIIQFTHLICIIQWLWYKRVDFLKVTLPEASMKCFQ